MRLAQLSRKLALRPVEIVDFLAKQNIQIEEGSNTRLDDAHVTLIMKHFAPAMLNEVEAELAAETVEEVMPESTMHTETVVEAVAVEPPVTGEAQPDQSFEGKDEASEAVTVVSEFVEQQAEVIRAPKVELPGLKVIGKIEIPEPKKKEVSVKDNEMPQHDEALPAPDTRRKGYEGRRTTNKRREERPRRNPIAVQREREAMEADQKKREAAEREKERRTRNYLKKVKASQPVKPARLVKEQVVDMSTELSDTPKTWWGRFKKWLKS